MIDNHAHPFDREPGDFDLRRLRLDLTEGTVGTSQGLLWGALLRRRLAHHLGVAAEDIDEARAAAVGDYRAYVAALFADAGISEVVMDPSWPPGSETHLGDFADLSGAAIHPLLRIDGVIDQGLADGTPRGDILRLCDEALAAAVDRGVVGVKTIIAYRSGLEVDPAVTEDAATADTDPDAKALRDHVFRRVLRFAAETGLPIQVHTGMGDSDLRLRTANPLGLEEVLRTPEGGEARVVLLHGSYPFHEEAAWLAVTRPNVYVDLSLTPIMAPLGVGDRLLRMIDLAPIDRILVGTDAYGLPELFWFGAIRLREAWSEVAGSLAEAGLGAEWIAEARSAVFAGNARRLYGL